MRRTFRTASITLREFSSAATRSACELTAWTTSRAFAKSVSVSRPLNIAINFISSRLSPLAGKRRAPSDPNSTDFHGVGVWLIAHSLVIIRSDLEQKLLRHKFVACVFPDPCHDPLCLGRLPLGHPNRFLLGQSQLPQHVVPSSPVACG